MSHPIPTQPSWTETLRNRTFYDGPNASFGTGNYPPYMTCEAPAVDLPQRIPCFDRCRVHLLSRSIIALCVISIRDPLSLVRHVILILAKVQQRPIKLKSAGGSYRSPIAAHVSLAQPHRYVSSHPAGVPERLDIQLFSRTRLLCRAPETPRFRGNHTEQVSALFRAPSLSR